MVLGVPIFKHLGLQLLVLKVVFLLVQTLAIRCELNSDCCRDTSVLIHMKIIMILHWCDMAFHE